MAGLGIVLGILAFLLVAAVTGEFTPGDKSAGILPGIIAGIWVAWPCFHHARVSRYNFLHPVPKEYKHPLKQAFAQIRDILADVTYNFGDKWHVSTADTVEKRITASLKFTEEESQLEGSSLQNIRTKKERVQRLIELEVQFKDTESDTTIIQFDFHPRIEGSKWHACDDIVAGLLSRVEAALGPGTLKGKPADTKLPAPPNWLIGLGVVGVASLALSVVSALFKGQNPTNPTTQAPAIDTPTGASTTAGPTPYSPPYSQTPYGNPATLQQGDRQRNQDIYFARLDVDKYQKIIENCRSDLVNLEMKIADPTVSYYEKGKLTELKNFRQQNLTEAEANLKVAQDKLTSLTAGTPLISP